MSQIFGESVSNRCWCHFNLAKVVAAMHIIATYETTVINQEKSFAVYWVSSKCRENFHSFYFNCIKNAKESHC